MFYDGVFGSEGCVLAPPDDDLRIETYVGVYSYKSYNKGDFNSASVGVKIV
jgi:hypothetical protein